MANSVHALFHARASAPDQRELRVRFMDGGMYRKLEVSTCAEMIARLQCVIR